MKLVPIGIANHLSHTTTGAASSSIAVLDGIGGQSIALVGVGGGVVRSIVSALGGLELLPKCVLLLSASVGAFVDLPVYLRIHALQGNTVTVMAPPEVLDRVVEYMEDVLAEEEASVALLVQRYTTFTELDLHAPTLIPLETHRPTTSSSTSLQEQHHQPSSSGAFDDTVLSQWLVFVHRTASPAREGLFRYNAIVTHRRVVVDGIRKHQSPATAAALLTSMSSASSLHDDAKDCVKEDATTVVAFLEHIPESSEALGMLASCDLVASSVSDEAMVNDALRRGLRTLDEPASQPPSRSAVGGDGDPAEEEHKDSVHPASSQGGDDEHAPQGSGCRSGNVEKEEAGSNLVSPILLYRFAAHEPPVTFTPGTFVARAGFAYQVNPLNRGGVACLGVHRDDRSPAHPRHHRSVQAARSGSTKARSLATSSLSSGSRTVGGGGGGSDGSSWATLTTLPAAGLPGAANRISDLGAKLVTEDAADVVDDNIPLQLPAHSEADAQKKMQNRARAFAAITQHRGDTWSQMQSAVSVHREVTVEDVQRLRRYRVTESEAVKVDLQRESPYANDRQGGPLLATPASASAFDPEQCPFASSLRAEHYDTGKSQLELMRRQMRNPTAGGDGGGASRTLDEEGAMGSHGGQVFGALRGRYQDQVAFAHHRGRQQSSSTSSTTTRPNSATRKPAANLSRPTSSGNSKPWSTSPPRTQLSPRSSLRRRYDGQFAVLAGGVSLRLRVHDPSDLSYPPTLMTLSIPPSAEKFEVLSCDGYELLRLHDDDSNNTEDGRGQWARSVILLLRDIQFQEGVLGIASELGVVSDEDIADALQQLQRCLDLFLEETAPGAAPASHRRPELQARRDHVVQNATRRMRSVVMPISLRLVGVADSNGEGGAALESISDFLRVASRHPRGKVLDVAILYR